MAIKAWQAALAACLLVAFVVFLGFRFLGPQAQPTFDRSPAGPTPVQESNP